MNSLNDKTVPKRRTLLSPMKMFLIASALLGLSGRFQAVHAARPFVTDDARLTTAGSCQVESWTRLNRAKLQAARSEEYWAFPACNLTGNLEVTLGGALGRPSFGPQSSDYVMQVKSLFRRLSPGDWAAGIAVGKVLHPEINPGPNQFGNTYFYLPWSYATSDEQWVIHVNLGALRDRVSKDARMTWGSGLEWKFNERWLGISEVFGDTSGGRYWQVGVRYSIVVDLFQVDASVGRPFGDLGPSQQSIPLPYGPARWLSFGLRYTPAKFFD